MSRSISWRRYKEKCIVEKRLKRIINSWYYRGYYDANGINKETPTWRDYIGSPIEKMYKTYTVKKNESKFKNKWNGKKRPKDISGIRNRKKDNENFVKMLREDYGLRRINT